MTREDCIKKLEEVRNRYTQLNSGIVFYRSPITNDVECRVAYFKNIAETALWLDEKEKFYRKNKIPFAIYLDTGLRENEGYLWDD